MSQAIRAIGSTIKLWPRGTFFCLEVLVSNDSSDALDEDDILELRYYRVVALVDQEARSVVAIADESDVGFTVFQEGDDNFQFEMVQTLVAKVIFVVLSSCVRCLLATLSFFHHV